MSPETFPLQEFDYKKEEEKILEGVEPSLVSILKLGGRRPLTEKSQ
ncbi:MAG: hypothetical protein HYT94_05275 [Parcubacteria group bacterium]|nr:hypothetical protein [Parcubacteria group bacterium]